MTVIYGKFNNNVTSASIMKSNGRNTVVINKPLKKVSVSDEVFNYASDEIGAFFMKKCQEQKYKA